jgi:hypothetical protein
LFVSLIFSHSLVGKRTRASAVDQGVPQLCPHPNKKSRTGSGAAPHFCRQYPTTFGYWSSFKKDACDFKFPVPPGLVSLANQEVAEDISSETFVEGALNLNVYKVFNKVCPPEWNCILAPKEQYPDKLIGLPDGLIWVEKEGARTKIVSGEVKTPWTLRKGGAVNGTDFSSGQEIVSAWDFSLITGGKKTDPPKYAWGAKLGTNMRQSLAQLVGYMIDNRTRYGYLTAYDRTWFLRLVDCDTIEITDAIRDTDSTSSTTPSLLRSFIFVTSLARESTVSEDEVKKHNSKRRRSDGKEGDDGLSDKDNMKGNDKSRKPPPDSSGGDSSGDGDCSEKKAGEATDTIGSDAIGNGVFDSLCVPLVRDSDLEWGRVLGWGRHGTVVQVGWQGSLMALKMFDLSKGAVQAMENEVSAYGMAQKLQGSIIPRLLVKFVSPSGQVCGVGLDIGAPLPEDDEDWTLQQSVGSAAALKALKELGIHHNDVRNENFVQINGVVNVIDFEDVSLVPAVSAC